MSALAFREKYPIQKTIKRRKTNGAETLKTLKGPDCNPVKQYIIEDAKLDRKTTLKVPTCESVKKSVVKDVKVEGATEKSSSIKKTKKKKKKAVAVTKQIESKANGKVKQVKEKKKLLMNGQSDELVLDTTTEEACDILRSKMQEKLRERKVEKVPQFLSLLRGLTNPSPEDDCDMKTRGQILFGYLTHHQDVNVFLKKYWEKKPMYQQQADNYLDGLFSTKEFDLILRSDYVEYGKNLDLTSYEDGKRETHNPVGRAHAPVVWDYFGNGCSVRLLNPQTFSETVWQTLAYLQEFLGCFVGANVYLTPAGTQGFAPHWDDIEALVLQLEGKKRWRVYEPRFPQEELPRFSSPNLTDDDIGSPILDVVLTPGDVLYMPRGYIHQGEALEDVHSLHITISYYQKSAYADYFEQLFSKQNISIAATKAKSLREGLPLGYGEFMGKLQSMKPTQDVESKKSKQKKKKTSEASLDAGAAARRQFREKVKEMVAQHLLTDELLDSAADALMRQFVRQALPPYCTPAEHGVCVTGDGEHWRGQRLRGKAELEPDTRVRLLSPATSRVWLSAEGEWRLSFALDNSREYEGRPEQWVALEEAHLPSLRLLHASYPSYTRLEELPLPRMEDKMGLGTQLYELGVLMTEHQLEAEDDWSGSDCEDWSGSDCEDWSGSDCEDWSSSEGAPASPLYSDADQRQPVSRTLSWRLK